MTARPIFWKALTITVACLLIVLSRDHVPIEYVFEMGALYAEPPRDVLLYSGVIWGAHDRYCRLLRTRTTGPVAIATFECRFPAMRREDREAP